ncbi:NAD(P)/FAD-dependent oxidoreductase [Candidatus Woesearchaeota archaeon]|nr:NAD(P)/FAD-dependent oxidoreductase [Candidatus Woesearchaeota archaeon]
MISVIGAGPSGCYSAYLLSKAGERVSVFEEHKEIGNPVQCTGIVTSSINSIVKPPKSCITNRVAKARIFSRKNFVDIKLRNENIILDRERFDSYLAEKAVDAGAKIYTDHKFIGNEGKNVITSKKTSKSEIIIGADGPLSRVAKVNNMLKKREYWFGFQARARLDNDNIVEFYPNIGTFGWVVPENRETVRIGILGKENAKTVFENFLKKKIPKNKIIGYQTGIVPVYNPGQQTRKNHIYLVGDAAGQVKATTGGGIIQSLTAAEALADSIINKKDYEKEWRKRLGKDLWLHLKMRKMMDKFSESDWQYLIELFSKKKNNMILQKHDRDYPMNFMLKLLISEPRLVYFAKYLF